MKLIKVLKEKDVFPEKKIDEKIKFKLREASRAVLFDDSGRIALLFVSKYNYHKLPGGGFEKNENKIAALRREVKEETGCTIKIGKEIGCIAEYRNKFRKVQKSYCYFANKIKQGKTDFDHGEKKDGFRLKWIKFEKAIPLLKKDRPEDYMGKFIQRRDILFLEEAAKLK